MVNTVVVLDWWLDLYVLKVFSNLNDSIILPSWKSFWVKFFSTYIITCSINFNGLEWAQFCPLQTKSNPCFQITDFEEQRSASLSYWQFQQFKKTTQGSCLNKCMPYYHNKHGITMVIFREGNETWKADSNMKFKKNL